MYICILMYSDIFANGLFTETTKRFQLNCCHNSHWKTWLKVASYCFLKSGGNANICILKSFPWARGCCVHVFLVLIYTVVRVQLELLF